MGQPEREKVAISDYVAIEQAGEIRYEFHNGELFGMAGGSYEHGVICGNCHGVLRDATRKTGRCQAFLSELKIEIQAGQKYVYPDAGLCCPKAEKSEILSGAITNPCLIIEVVSESSANYDRGAKLRYYFSLPSMQEYLLISQSNPFITIFRRRGDLMKIDHYVGLDAVVPLECIDTHITMADIYENVELPSLI